MGLAYYLNICLTVGGIANLGFLYWRFREGQAWGLQWMSVWWLLAFLQILLWDLADVLGWSSPVCDVGWRWVAFKGFQCIAQLGCTWWGLAPQKKGV
jgi:hypothetical protein